MRQSDFLRSLEQLRFTGQLVYTHSTQQSWTIHLIQGKIAQATGGTHAVRRWRRNLLTYCPRIPTYRLAWQVDLAKVRDDELVLGWEYALLKLWMTQRRISLTQAESLMRATVMEVLFDLLQAGEVTEQIYRSPFLTAPSFPLIQVEEAVYSANLLYQAWQKAKLTPYSPNDAPIIKQPNIKQPDIQQSEFQQWSLTYLQEQYFQEQYSQEKIVRLLNGQKTLREISAEIGKDTLELTTILLPCIQQQWIELTQIPDLPGLVFQREPLKPTLPVSTAPQATIACIDDSLMVRKMMEELLTASGYQFLGIDDPIRAIGLLLTRKPEFIFLDLVMPNANGYEICEKLRKLSCFRNTPIVILTGNDGYANRLRSNFVGATDFLSKPLDAEMVLAIISKHLKLEEPSLSTSVPT